MSIYKHGENMKIGETLHDGSGRLLAASGLGHEIIGEVEVLYKSKRDGHSIFTRSIGKNDLLLTGAVFLTEKVNNVRSTFQTTPIDQLIGVHSASQIDFSAASIPNEKICGIMVGVGGSGDTYNTVHPVHRTDLTVPGYTPFRVVPVDEDLSPELRRQYILRVVQGDYVYYYGKRFEANRDINVLYEDGTEVPTNVHAIGDSNGKYIKTFTKFTTTIDESEIREAFKIKDGSTRRSRVNSIGLITGYPGKAEDSGRYEEYFNVRTLTTLNMENRELKDSESTLSIIYRLYFV